MSDEGAELRASPGSLPVGEEPQPQGSITHLTVLRNAGISVLSEAGGDIDSDHDPSTGLYFQDTRYLSRLRFTIQGHPMLPLDESETEYSLSSVHSNPALTDAEGHLARAQTLVVRRRRVLHDGGLIEALTISNYGMDQVSIDVRWHFGADFADIFVIRGYERKSVPLPVAWEFGIDTAKATYPGADGKLRTLHLGFQPDPDAINEGQAVTRLRLGPGETRTLEVLAKPEERPYPMSIGAAAIESEDRRERWLEMVTRFESDDDQLNAVLERALLDILALQSRTAGLTYTAAGVPWFDTLFGRDGLITGMEMLPFAPEILRAALAVLALHQADSYDVMHDAEPGKLPHELRWGELAGSGEVPFGKYYGSVDVTPLFIMAAHDYWRWTSDDEFVRELWPSIERALGWCRDALARSPNGFLAYSRESEQGLENQGWKDSFDSIVWPDGRMLNAPIALVEVQAYMCAAYRAFVSLAGHFDASTNYDALRDEGIGFEERFHASFTDSETGYILALDGHGKAARTPASNGGHVLWARVARPEFARRFAERALEQDMFSGWGVRTLASTVPGYNPLGYHKGTVWPHDNALLLAGFRNYGLDEQADLLATSLIDAAKAFRGFRVPELFSGDARQLRPVPTPYPVASRPQAWSAASIPSILASLLGIQPSGRQQLCIDSPALPPGVSFLRLHNLRCGDGAADLAFRRVAGKVSVEVEDLRGGVDVVFSRRRFPGR